MAVADRPPDQPVARRKRARRRQIPRLFRLRRAAGQSAFAPRPGRVARAGARDARCPHRPAANARRHGRTDAGCPGRGASCRAAGLEPSGPRRRRLVAPRDTVDLEGQTLPHAGTRVAVAPARTIRGGGHRCIRCQFARPAAGRACRAEGGHGTRPRHSYRGESRRGRRYRQTARYRHGLPLRAAARRARRTRHPGGAGATPRRATHLHWQRHRQPRNRSARRRTAAQRQPAWFDQAHGERGRRLGVFGQQSGQPRVSRSGREPARRGVHRPPGARPAGRTGEDRPQEHRRRPVST